MNNSHTDSLINGIAADYLNISDRSIHYGDGLFETILCRENKLYHWRQHYQRLRSSAERLKISCPDESVFLDDIRNLIENSGSEGNRVIKIILSRGSGERGYQFTKATKANRIVLISEAHTEHSSLLSKCLLSGELFVCQQQVSINENLAGIKHLNRLDNVMARNEWNDKTGQFIDGLMLDADHRVIEGTMSNIFAVKDKQLYTPALQRSGVRGVMRDVILELAVKSDIPVSESDFAIDDLTAMDELFITNSLIGMKRVSKLGDTIYKDHTLTDLLFNYLLGSEENDVQAV